MFITIIFSIVFALVRCFIVGCSMIFWYCYVVHWHKTVCFIIKVVLTLYILQSHFKSGPLKNINQDSTTIIFELVTQTLHCSSKSLYLPLLVLLFVYIYIFQCWYWENWNVHCHWCFIREWSENRLYRYHGVCSNDEKRSNEYDSN